MSKNITKGRDEPQTAAALEARRVTAQAAHQRVHHVLARMRREKAPITVAAVARRAGVSRTFLYTNPEARTAVADAAAASGLQRAADLTAQDTEQEATWRERALNAEDALKTAHTEILQQRTRSAISSAKSGTWKPNGPRRSIQRITTENTNLKQRVRQLTTDNRTLDERLKAARSNLRFQDKRLADLEAQILDTAAAILTDRQPQPDGRDHHPGDRGRRPSRRPYTSRSDDPPEPPDLPSRTCKLRITAGRRPYKDSRGR